VKSEKERSSETDAQKGNGLKTEEHWKIKLHTFFGSLFCDAFSVSRLYGADDRVTSE
jgi:hypothetical protein